MIPSCLELPDDIDPMIMKMNKMMMMMMIYHKCRLKLRKPTICVDFEPFNFLVQQHENTKPTKSNTTNYILFDFVGMEFSLVQNEYACHITCKVVEVE